LVQSKIAEQQQEIAEQQRLLTDEQRQIALQEKVRAEKKEQEAVQAKVQANHNADVAKQALLETREQQKKIVENEKREVVRQKLRRWIPLIVSRQQATRKSGCCHGKGKEAPPAGSGPLHCHPVVSNA
jgi:hypothetical protein